MGREVASASRLLEELGSLDPFADVLWFLRMNPLVATFGVADYQTKAQEEVERGVTEAPDMKCL